MTQSQAVREAIGRRYIDFTTAQLASWAALDWEYTFPIGYDWKFVMGTATLVTSATVGNRYYGCHIYDNSSGNPGIHGKTNKIIWGLPHTLTVGPSNTGAQSHYYRSNSVLPVADGTWALPVPDIIFPGGWTIGSENFPLAGDTWSQISILLEAFIPLPGL